MIFSDIFFNDVGRLRSGWRFAIFIGIYLVVLLIATNILQLALYFLLGNAAVHFLEGYWGWIVQALLLFSTGAVVGWACGRIFEDLPARALGWALHRGWARDLLMGTLTGIASLMLAACIATVFGGFRFTLSPPGMLQAIGKTVLFSLFVFILAAAAEEVLFRGYPLQTLVRARYRWIGVILTSMLFASVHLDNPNVVPGFTFINTTLAGIWLGAAYLKTRSLWFPLGIHWAWNWTMGAILGLPVSGIDKLTPAPLLRASVTGPAWLTGGSYGIEGGAACTVALIISTIFIWYMPFVRPTEEMLRLTDQENPKLTKEPISIRNDE
ncbi:MAG: type II CAAX endopeptidase family protein [Pyrinomonadaceae bacterium]